MEPRKKRGLGKKGVWPLLSHGPIARELLVEALNAQPDGARAKAQSEEFRELVRDFNHIESFAQKGGFAKVRKLLEDFSLNPDFRLRGSGLDENIAKRMKRMGAIYKSMRLIPQPAYPEKDGWRFYWARPWHMDSKNKRVFYWFYLAFIYDLALKGELRLVRECDECHQWFFGRRGGTRFCPRKNCRERHWRKSPEGKARRAAYMRARYQREKKNDEDSLRAVMRKKERSATKR